MSTNTETFFPLGEKLICSPLRIPEVRAFFEFNLLHSPKAESLRL
jgi:hypothetical protein